MTKAEQETVIRWDRDEQVVHIWSADRSVWRKMERWGVPMREETQAQRTGEVTGRFYEMPLSEFRLTKKRTFGPRTPEQLAAGRLRALCLRRPDETTGGNGAKGASE